MRSVIAIFFLTVLVSIQTPIGQLLKIPILIEHFIKHRKQTNISFISFLNEHYSSNHKDQDLPEDEQLPFMNNSFFALGYAIIPTMIRPNAIVAPPAVKELAYREFHILPQHTGSIFHPPRF